METILTLLDVAERLHSLCLTVQDNKDQCGRLAGHVSSLRTTLQELQGRAQACTPPTLESGLAKLRTCFTDAEELVRKYSRTGALGRVWRAGAMEREFEGMFQRLDDIRSLLSLSLQVEQRGQVQSVQDTVDRSEQKLDSLNDKMDKLLHSDRKVKGVPVTPAVPALAQDADKLLDAVRTQFVEKASLPLLKQLLDGLQEECVLNTEEAEAVLEEQSARADRARYLIDVVRKKGCKASQKMIAQLRQKDASLAETLGLA
ncbi:hypothetical protein ACEWY4_006048 [Coilia grayii]|uniref:CARD domain-containing protein n=1 Tax=Coilia grayii TaxID=363190 RepID=A0ABD1KCW3_9TELE